jgi:hypothetical protein
MHTYAFTFILSGLDYDDVNDDTANKLYEAGCDDVLFGVSNGVVVLDFNREAEDLDAALLSAIRDVRSTNIVFTAIKVQL